MQIGKVRLRGGERFSEGRVEVFFNEQWGTVCDDNWDLKDGNILCRQLGFGTATFVSHWAEYGQGTNTVSESEHMSFAIIKAFTILLPVSRLFIILGMHISKLLWSLCLREFVNGRRQRLSKHIASYIYASKPRAKNTSIKVSRGRLLSVLKA